MRRVLILAAAIAPLVAGCAMNSKVSTPDARVPAAFEAPPAVDGLPETSLDRWWELYEDAQLETLVDEALKSGFDQEIALARLEQAHFQTQATKALTLPQGDLTGTAGRAGTEVLEGGQFPNSPGVQTSGSATFNVSWELDLFGRLRTTRRLANADYQTAAYTYEATRTALAASVADSLFVARGLAMQLADAEETLRINRDLENIARLRVQHGLAPSSDLDQATANAGQAAATVENLTSQVNTARRLLLLLVGRGTDPLASLEVPASVGTPPPAPALIPSRLLERRPDVKLAEWALNSQLERHKLAKLALFPKIDLRPGATIAQVVSPLDQTSLFWNLALGLTVPVLDRPRLLAEAGIQRAVGEELVIGYERAVQTAYVEAENALVLLDSDRRRVDILRAAEARAEAAYRKRRQGYVLGVNDLQEALFAEDTWRLLRIQRAAAETTLMQRSVQLFRALGGGWSPEAPAVSAPQTIAVRGTK